MSMASRSPVPSTSGQAPSLNLGNMSSKDFKRLLDTQSLVDVTLACDGGQISAHKVVLSACSSYINKILESHPVEHPIIILPELNIRDIRILVNYMYTGELLTMNAPSHSLLKTAAVLNINSLNDFFNESSSSPSLTTSTTSTTAASLQPTINNKSPATNNNNNSNNYNNNNYNNLKNSNNHTKQTRKYNFKNKQNGINSNTILAANRDDAPNSDIVADNNINVKYLNINNLQEFLGSNYTNHLDDDDDDDDVDDDLDDDDLDDDRDALMDESSDLHLDDEMMMLPQHDTTINSQFDGATNGAKNQKASSLNSSKNRLHLDMQFRCPVCEQDFYTICSFEYHMQRNHFVSSFGCEICDKPFASLRYVLTDHMRRCHGWLAEQEV